MSSREEQKERADNIPQGGKKKNSVRVQYNLSVQSLMSW